MTNVFLSRLIGFTLIAAAMCAGALFGMKVIAHEGAAEAQPLPACSGLCPQSSLSGTGSVGDGAGLSGAGSVTGTTGSGGTVTP